MILLLRLFTRWDGCLDRYIMISIYCFQSLYLSNKLFRRNSAPQIEVDRKLSALSENIVLQIVMLQMFIFITYLVCIAFYFMAF